MTAGLRARRGSAIFLVLVITIALAALAGSAVLHGVGRRASLSNYHDQEHDLLYGAAGRTAGRHQ